MNASRLATITALLLGTACAQQEGNSNVSAIAGVDQGTAFSQAKQTSPPSGKGRGLPAGAMRAQMVEIMDMNGFEQPLPAAFGFIPVGWRAQGGVQWGQQFMCTNGYNFNWVAQSPDGLQSVAILPQVKWETNNYGAGPSSPGCQSAQMSSVQQYLQQLVASMRPGARMIDYRPRPDIAAKFQHLNIVTPTAKPLPRPTITSAFCASKQLTCARRAMSVASANLARRSKALKPTTIPTRPPARLSFPACTTTRSG